MIDATHLKAHRTTAGLLKKGRFSAASAEPKVDRIQNFMLSVTSLFHLTEGQTSDYTSATALLEAMPEAN